MAWTAVVPLKLGKLSKSRLGTVLDADARLELIKRMAQHVLAVLDHVPEVGRVILLADKRPDWWAGEWAEDTSGQLNAALAAWQEAHVGIPVLVIHGDLPYLTTAEVSGLLEAAQVNGVAMATDTVGSGTNALAISDGRRFCFRFGDNSRRAHDLETGMVVIDRIGLARDIDTPADLAGLQQSKCLASANR